MTAILTTPKYVVSTADLERFHSKIALSEDCDCIEWQGWRNRPGYGRFWLRHDKKKVPVFAHRLAWEIHNGRPLREGEIVMHRCDNPPCCNPAHLMVGSILENVHDMHSKGRAAVARKKHWLTEKEALLALLLLSLGNSPESVAARINDNCGAATIRDLKSGRTWKHLPRPTHPLEGYDPLKDYDNKEALCG